LASDEHVSEFWVISLLNPVPADDEISDETRSAMKSYLAACETALDSRQNFFYRRVVVFRSDEPVPVPSGADGDGKGIRAQIAYNALVGREPLAEHCVRMLNPNVPRAQGSNRRPELKFYVDSGRTIDTAIALALTEAGDPLGLVIEISLLALPPNRASTTRPPRRQAMALLTMNYPRNVELCRSFKQVYDSIADNRRNLPALDDVEDILARAIR
jgi:hypothetical protein